MSPARAPIFDFFNLQVLFLVLLDEHASHTTQRGVARGLHLLVCTAGAIRIRPAGETEMDENNGLHEQEDGTPEEKLWRAVIATTIREWIRGPLRVKREAERYLFNDEKDFPEVCSSAGINVNYLRSRLASIRARPMPVPSVPAVRAA